MWLLFLPLICSFSSCEKNEPNPTGSNTITCKVNGKDFKPKNDDWKKDATSAGVTNDTLGVGAVYFVGDVNEAIGFRIENFKGKGTYTLNSSKDNYGRYYLEGMQTFTDANHTGEVVITHHVPGNQRGIVAGTFSYTTVDPRTGQLYKITDGKFDMTYTVQ